MNGRDGFWCWYLRIQARVGMLIEALDGVYRSAVPDPVDLASEATHSLQFGLQQAGGLALVTRRLL